MADTPEDAFKDWVTFMEAAASTGVTRQAIHKAAKDGHLKARRFPNSLWLVHRSELARWAAQRRQAQPAGGRLFGLTPRQAEMLLAIGRGGHGPTEYAHFITTTRSLQRRGLVDDVTRGLTPLGADTFKRLIRSLEHEQDVA